MTKKNEDSVVFEFFTEIGIINQLSQTLLERALSDGLKMSHFVVLNHFSRLGGPHSPQDLARALQVTKGAMTNTLQRLEKRGLVDIQPDPGDGRAKCVTLTASGLHVRNEAIKAITPTLDEVGKRFTKTRLKEALPLLRNVRGYLDKARDRDNAADTKC